MNKNKYLTLEEKFEILEEFLDDIGICLCDHCDKEIGVGIREHEKEEQKQLNIDNSIMEIEILGFKYVYCATNEAHNKNVDDFKFTYTEKELEQQLKHVVYSIAGDIKKNKILLDALRRNNETDEEIKQRILSRDLDE